MHYSALPLPCRAAYFIGRNAAMRDHHLDDARATDDAQARSRSVKYARLYNHELIRWTVATRKRLENQGRVAA